MFKFRLQCPHCQKEIIYNILGRDYDRLKCPHCHKAYEVEIKMNTYVFVLILLFGIDALFQKIGIFDDLIRILISAIFAGCGTLVIVKIMSEKLIPDIFFNTKEKVMKKH